MGVGLTFPLRIYFDNSSEYKNTLLGLEQLIAPSAIIDATGCYSFH